MDYDLRPYDGVGALRLGISREEVHKVAGLPSDSFLKAGVSLTDQYDSLGILVYYDSEEKVEAIELFSPAKPTLHSREVLGRPIREIIEWWKSLDPNLAADEAGLTSRTLGIGAYAPGAARDSDDPVQGVIIFKRGYYD
jgi:hypothetical protein